MKNATTGKNEDMVFHETKLSFGSTIYWYENAVGKQYTTSKTVQALTYINMYNSKSPNQNTYFKGDNGNYYVMSSNGSNLRRYTGDTSFMNGAEFVQQ